MQLRVIFTYLFIYLFIHINKLPKNFPGYKKLLITTKYTNAVYKVRKIISERCIIFKLEFLINIFNY